MADLGWHHVQIHPANPNTHYVGDIAAQLARTLGFSDSVVSSQTGSTSVQVGTNIDAGGPVSISDVTINIGSSGYESAQRDAEFVAFVGESIAELLSSSRLALIFLGMDETDRAHLARVRSDLWDGALAALTASGLVLVDISNPDVDGELSSIWPPPPDIAFDLPATLADSARDEAAEEISQILVSEKLCPTEADALVPVKLLVSSTTSIVALHEALARGIAGWPTWTN
jgi:hypothetical protein